MTLKHSAMPKAFSLRYGFYLMKSQFGWLSLVHIILSLLAGPMLLFIIFLNKGNINPEQSLLFSASINQFNAYIGLYIGAIIGGFIWAFALTGNLHKKRQVDFFHSMPVKRGSYYRAYWFTAVVMEIFTLLIAFGLMLVVNLMFAKTYGFPPLSYMPIHFVQCLFLFLVSFALTMLAVQLCGTSLSTMAIGVLFSIGITGLFSFVLILLHQFSTFGGSSLLDDLIWHSSPWMALAELAQSDLAYTNVLTYSFAYPLFAQKVWIVGLIATVVSGLLAYLLYARRPVERAGETILYGPVRLLVKTYVFFIVITGVALAFYEMGNKSLIVAFVGSVLLALVTHLIIEMGFTRTLRGAKKGVISTIILTIACLGVFYSVEEDVFGYNTKLPLATNIDGIHISNFPVDDFEDIYQYTAEKEGRIQDEELKKETLNLIKALIEANPSQQIVDGSEKSTAYSRPEVIGKEEDNDDSIYYSVDSTDLGVTFYQGGREQKRYFKGPTRAVVEPLRKLYDNPSFRDFLYQDVLDLKIEEINNFSAVDQQSEYVKEQHIKGFSYGYDGLVPQADQSHRADVAAFMKAYKNDIQKRTFATVAKEPAYVYSLTMAKDDDNRAFSRLLPIYPGDTETMALVNTWVEKGWVSSQAELIQAQVDTIASMRVYRQNANGEYTLAREVKDKNEIYNIVQNTSRARRPMTFAANLDTTEVFVPINKNGDRGICRYRST